MITESIAIALYLTDRFAAAGLGPQVGDAKRGPYLSWLAYYAGVTEPVVTLGFAGLADNADMQRMFRDRGAMDRRVLAALENGSYILGEKLSGADILIASIGQFSRAMLPAARGGCVSRTLQRAARLGARSGEGSGLRARETASRYGASLSGLLARFGGAGRGWRPSTGWSATATEVGIRLRRA